MPQGSLITTSYCLSWYRCECGEVFASRFRLFDFFLHRNRIRLMEAVVALEIATHQVDHVNKEAKGVLSGQAK